MLNFLPWPILFLINSIIILCNVMITAIPIAVIAVFKLLLPFNFVKIIISKLNYFFYRVFVEINAFALFLTNKIKFDVQGNDLIKIKKSCIIISNHLSWADIIILLHVYRGKIPITKFFLKQSLVFIPIVGLACLGLGMPFLKRYSKAQMIKNPKLKYKDIQTTKKACKSLTTEPSALINFVEGTRYTKQKALRNKSPYKHLMLPKTPSLGVALSEVGHDIECILNTTLCYKSNKHSPFIDMLKGRLKDVYARVEVIDVDDSLIGDYLNDKEFKQRFAAWIRDLWAKKDEQLDNYLNSCSNKTK